MEEYVKAEELTKERNIQPFQILEMIRDGLPAYENGRRVYDTASLEKGRRYTLDEIITFARDMFSSDDSPEHLFFNLPTINHRNEGEMPFPLAWFGKRIECPKYLSSGERNDFYTPPQMNLYQFLMDMPSDDVVNSRAKEVYDLQALELPRDVLHINFEIPLNPEKAKVLLDRVMGFSFLKSDLNPKKDSMKGRHFRNNQMKALAQKIAKRMWLENPDLTIPDIALSDEFSSKCVRENGELYTEETVRRWIKEFAPNRKPGRRPIKK